MRSVPEHLRGDGGALGEAFQLRPHDRAVHAASEGALRESAICAGHDAVAANDVGIAQQPFGHEVGMLDDIGRMRNEPRHQHLAVGQRHVLPHLPFVLVARISGLETIGADIDPQHEIDDVLDRHVEHIYFGCAAESQKVRNIECNDKVSLTVTPPHFNWEDIRGLSNRGRAAPVTDPQEINRVSELMLRKFPHILRYALAGKIGG